MQRWLAIVLLTACEDPHTWPESTADARTVDARGLDARPVDARQIRVSNVTVSLTFDDTSVDQFQVGAMVRAHGMRATFFVNSPRIGHSGFMTRAQLDSLQSQGNEIGGHTLDHPFLTQLDADAARRQICDDRNTLIALGFDARSFAYPYGASNASVEQIARDCGYVSARTVGGLYASSSCESCPYANQMPPANLYRLTTPPSVAGAVSADSLEAYIIDAEQHGGGWVPFVFHHVCDACGSNEISPAVLDAFLDRLEARGVRALTVAEAAYGSSVPP
jgi:peptidoglycan/xylan/chitin deacetylase (PgdA/CDA1 family)